MLLSCEKSNSNPVFNNYSVFTMYIVINISEGAIESALAKVCLAEKALHLL